MADTPTQKTIRQVCTCENCGNEAEMIITCTLPPAEEAPEKPAATVSEPPAAKNKVPGQATCTRCGNEADIWVDF